jgi:hypothetical protein
MAEIVSIFWLMCDTGGMITSLRDADMQRDIEGQGD